MLTYLISPSHGTKLFFIDFRKRELAQILGVTGSCIKGALSSNIHIQILQTDLHIFLEKLIERIC